MKHIGLFEGIGGFSYAVKLMGWETKAWCEWNEFGQKVLRYHFPEAEGFGDITKTDFKKYANTIDILTGGFPCQPYSTAGKRLGKEDERHLWPEMLRAIREIQPCWVIGENVHGLVSWNGGLVFHEVQTDLEVEGYEVWPVILPACAINAPHRRDRVWFIAYSHNARANYRSEIDGNGQEENKGWQGQPQPEFGQDSGNGITTNSNTDAAGERWNEWQSQSEGNLWEQFPTQSPLCSGDDGISRELDGITFSKWRNESLKAFGNAIVPQVALQLLKTIAQMSNEMPKRSGVCGKGKK